MVQGGVPPSAGRDALIATRKKQKPLIRYAGRDLDWFKADRQRTQWRILLWMAPLSSSVRPWLRDWAIGHSKGYPRDTGGRAWAIYRPVLEKSKTPIDHSHPMRTIAVTT